MCVGGGWGEEWIRTPPSKCTLHTNLMDTVHKYAVECIETTTCAPHNMGGPQITFRLVDWHRVHCLVLWLPHQPLNFLASTLCPYLSSILALLATSSGGLVHWTRTNPSDRYPPFILFTSSSITNSSWYNSNSTVWDSSTDTQTGHTKHWQTMLITKVYNVCGC